MKNPEHSKRKHSEFSPSSAKRWMTCPGSVRMARTAPPQLESPYAREGTDAHECLEFIVRRYRDVDSAKSEALAKWPAEMVDHAIASAARLFSPDLRPSKTAKLLIEARVVVKSITHRMYGTLDYSWLDHWGQLTVVDYKYGAGVEVLPVDDDGKPNPQLMIYAFGLAEKFHFDFESVKLAIIQPRIWSEDGDALTHAVLPIAKLKEFGRELSEAVKAASHPHAPLIAGDHCRWCPASATCPENARKGLEDANIAFDVDSGIQAAPSPLTLTTKTLPKILDACTHLEQWIKAVREHAYRLAEDGEAIPGYKLVAKRAQRIWLPEAENEAKKIWKDMIYETMAPRFMSPAQLEKNLKGNAKEFTKKYTTAVSSGFNLVPESAKGAPVLSTAVFDHE